MSRATETIRIGEIEYAKVATRLLEFLEEQKDRVSIETTCEFKEGWALFRAVVTCSRGTFTGHSLGKTGGKKAFEKQETIAVGRALAFAGYLASGEIASFEEMQDYEDSDSHNRPPVGPAMAHAHKTLLETKTANDVAAWHDRVHNAKRKDDDTLALFTEDQLSELDRMADMRLKEIE